MLSQTGIYALKAVLFLARRNGSGPVPASAVAEALGIPGNYLAKTLHRLAREGVLRSIRGARGGYSLKVPAGDLTIARVVAPFEDLDGASRCLLGERACDPDNPCSAHARWEVWSGATAFGRTTVADLLGPDHDHHHDESSER